MRLSIRPEQMSVIQESAEEKFLQRLSSHLQEHYAKSNVTLSEDLKLMVNELSNETLYLLVKVSVQRARGRGLSYESTISAFSALMFEVSPNFDSHELVEPFFNDENSSPNACLDEIMGKLTEKDWQAIRKHYDIESWNPTVLTETSNEKNEE